MTDRHKIHIQLFVFGILTVLLVGILTSSNDQQDTDQFKGVDSLEYYKAKSKMLEAELMNHLDPVYRLKVIAGIPVDEPLTWKQKVIHKIDTKALTKHNPLDVWCRDDETGTWNKPASHH